MCFLLCPKNKFSSSTKIIWTSSFRELRISFKYNKNNNDPGIEPRVTSHSISCFTVSAYRVIFKTVSCHLSDWQTKQDLWYWHCTFLVFIAILNDQRAKCFGQIRENSKFVIIIFKGLVDSKDTKSNDFIFHHHRCYIKGIILWF